MVKKRVEGLVFIIIAAILYSTRYICAAIYMSDISAIGYYGDGAIRNGLKFVGNEPLILSAISLAIGVIYLIYAEVSEIKNNKKK